MFNSPRSLKCLAVLALFATAMTAGCSKSIVITQYPAFYDGSIKTIAVAPFRNQTDAANAGNIVSDSLSSMLMANGTYKVYNRNDMGVLTDERDLQLDLGKSPEKVEAMFQKLGDVDAILTGSVSTYSGTSNSQQRQDPIYQWNPNTKTTYIAGYRTYTYTRNESNVVATAALLRRDGSTIFASPVPVQATAWAEGSPPAKDVFALAADATGLVASQMLEQFAVVTKEIKVDPAKALRTASELFEDEWTFTDRFPVGSDTMFVVVTLPTCCDRNRFALKVVRKDQREYLAEQEVVWDSHHGGFGYRFNPSEIATKGGGPGVYTVKFYSGPKPIFMRDFRIY